MKNPIIDELRRIRDEHARRHNYDIKAMINEEADLEPWMKRKTVTLRGGRIVPAYPELHVKKKNRVTARTKLKTRCHS